VAFWKKYCDEAHRSSARLVTARAPERLQSSQLQADLKAIK